MITKFRAFVAAVVSFVAHLRAVAVALWRVPVLFALVNMIEDRIEALERMAEDLENKIDGVRGDVEDLPNERDIDRAIESAIEDLDVPDEDDMERTVARAVEDAIGELNLPDEDSVEKMIDEAIEGLKDDLDVERTIDDVKDDLTRDREKGDEDLGDRVDAADEAIEMLSARLNALLDPERFPTPDAIREAVRLSGGLDGRA